MNEVKKFKIWLREIRKLPFPDALVYFDYISGISIMEGIRGYMSNIPRPMDTFHE